MNGIVMKKTLNLVIMYFASLIFGLAFGTLMYAMFLNLLSYVAGDNLRLFTTEVLYHSFSYISFCVIFLACPLVAFYRIRHPGGISQTIIFLILCFVTWIVILPLNCKLCDYLDKNYPFATEESYLSKDYFRHVDNEVYYFTNDFTYSNGGMKADAVIIQTEKDDDYVMFGPVRDSNAFKLNTKAAPFREILVRESFRGRLSPSFVNFRALAVGGRYAFSRAFDDGILTFLFYLSFALALCSVYLLTNLFDWRLLTTTLFFLLTSLILSLNSGFFSPWLGTISQQPGGNAIYDFLAKWHPEPLVFVANCLLALIFTVIWIVGLVIKNHTQKKD